ncbi:hypothetical protein ACF06X_34220 [Streptomyces sp. NPDC015346]|uniref:hypothetical protein n=1 Tax=Streptomyces sp. NPDC015346 TaxID=3364954 RepID=UPI0036FB0CBB
MAGLALLSTLKQRDWPPTQHAFDTLLLLYQQAQFRLLDHLVPGCQWHLLDTEGLLPPPTREFLKDLISRNTAPARP